MSCEVCRSPLTKSTSIWVHTPFLYKSDGGECVPCGRAEKVYKELTGDWGRDAFGIYHELAHYIMLYRRLPQRGRDYNGIERRIDQYTIGRSQLHELRTLALQYETHKLLGWRPSLKHILGMSWSGLKDITYETSSFGGKPIVTHESAALKKLRSLLKQVSSRNVRLYALALEKLRYSSIVTR